MKPMNMMMPTAIQVGFLIRAMLCISASSSTADASRAPAFLTCTAEASSHERNTAGQSCRADCKLHEHLRQGVM